MSGSSETDPVALGAWAERKLGELIGVVGADPTFTQWRPERMTPADESARCLIDTWRGWLHVAGFGDEFVYEPEHSPPNRYWDPAVTRLWNHHAVATALFELCEMKVGFEGLPPDERSEFLHTQPWDGPLETIGQIGGRIAAVNLDVSALAG